MSDHPCTMPEHGRPDAVASCCRPPRPALTWTHAPTWRRAAVNTFNCLVGCSIGDVGVIVLQPILFPGAPMLATMVTAMAAGIVTSIVFETVMLRLREGFAWRNALRTAASMGLISMLAMEATANATDWALTGGRAMPDEPWFWGALAISLVAGFVAPLPYNYYMLRKHGRACH